MRLYLFLNSLITDNLFSNNQYHACDVVQYGLSLFYVIIFKVTFHYYKLNCFSRFTCFFRRYRHMESNRLHDTYILPLDSHVSS